MEVGEFNRRGHRLARIFHPYRREAICDHKVGKSFHGKACEVCDRRRVPPVDWEHGVEATTASPRCPGPKHNAAWIQKLTGLFEIHYTTTLNDAKISEIPLFFNTNTFSGFGLDSIDVGNEANRIDVLNVVTGLSANVGKWVVTNGVSAPLRKGADRGFDFEYNLQIQRSF